MPKSSPMKDVKRAVADLSRENDRTAAIIGGAFTENYLTFAIKARLRPLSNRFEDKLFEVYGPLATFSAKIDIGFALHLYGEGARSDLTAIKNIRNRFAHHIEIREFTEAGIAKLCADLRAPDRGSEAVTKAAIPKQRFIQAVMYLSAYLRVAAAKSTRPTPPEVQSY